jgi:acetylornithine/succinyldiaminopimelate/putrescine aminotransferase/predicted amino acid dehydrogenase
LDPADVLNPSLKRLLSLCRLDRRWARAAGAWLFDENGRRFLDCYAQYGAVALGHNAKEVVDAALGCFDRLEPAMVQPYRAPNAEALAVELCRLAPRGLTRCVFTTSGAEAVEAAIKLVRARGQRSLILAAEGSFHGKTMGALAATGQRHHSEGFGPAAPGFAFVPYGDAAALERTLRAHAGEVAALILEPVQGERGVFPPPRGYLARCRELCTEHGVALILDEVQTGLWRTGPAFACDAEGVTPDVLLVAKALGGGLFPLGACLCTAELWSDRFALGHSSTFANNNVACRVGLAALEALEEIGAQVPAKGAHLLAGLEAIAARCPNVVAGVRGAGLLTAIELKSPAPGAGLFASYLEHQGVYPYAVASLIAEKFGVLVLPTLGAANVLRVAPPLTVTIEQLDLALNGIGAALDQLEAGRWDLLAEALGAFEPRPPVASEPVRLPPPAARATNPRCWAFLSHYTRPEDVRTTEPSFHSRSDEELACFRDLAAELPFGVTVKVPRLVSATGEAAEGFILSTGLLPEQMLKLGRKRVEAEIVRGVELAHALGASVVGLGGFTTPYSRRGESVVGRGPIITTGSALTAAMAFAATQRVLTRRGLALEELEVAVVGARGSVGALCAQLLARARPRRLWLIGNPVAGVAALKPLAARLGCDPQRLELSTDLRRLEHCCVVLSATGAARPVLHDAPLKSGTLICDVARPADTSPRLRARRDLTIIDGGLVALPDAQAQFGAGSLQGLPCGVQLACLAETMLLALAGETRDRGIGAEVALEQVDEVLALAQHHGFRLSEPPLDANDAAPETEPAAQLSTGGWR